MKSENIKKQLNYIIMINAITDILNKKNNNIVNIANTIPDAITIGKKYASRYIVRINNMLTAEYIDTSILEELKREIKTDVSYIKADTAFRGYIQDGRENNYMIEYISNFIMSI